MAYIVNVDVIDDVIVKVRALISNDRSSEMDRKNNICIRLEKSC